MSNILCHHVLDLVVGKLHRKPFRVRAFGEPFLSTALFKLFNSKYFQNLPPWWRQITTKLHAECSPFRSLL